MAPVGWGVSSKSRPVGAVGSAGMAMADGGAGGILVSCDPGVTAGFSANGLGDAWASSWFIMCSKLGPLSDSDWLSGSITLPARVLRGVEKGADGCGSVAAGAGGGTVGADTGAGAGMGAGCGIGAGAGSGGATGSGAIGAVGAGGAMLG